MIMEGFWNNRNVASRSLFLDPDVLSVDVGDICTNCIVDVMEAMPDKYCKCHSRMALNSVLPYDRPHSCQNCKDRWRMYVQIKNIALRLFNRERGLAMAQELYPVADEVFLFQAKMLHMDRYIPVLEHIKYGSWEISGEPDSLKRKWVVDFWNIPTRGDLTPQAGSIDNWRITEASEDENSYEWSSSDSSIDNVTLQESIMQALHNMKFHLDGCISQDPKKILVCKLIESLALLIFVDIEKAQSTGDYLIAGYRFISAMTNMSFMEMYSWVSSYLDMAQIGPRTQGGIFDASVAGLEDVSKLLVGDAMYKFKKFFFALSAIGVGRLIDVNMDMASFEKIWSHISTFFKKLDPITNLFDFVIWVIKNGKDFLEGNATMRSIFIDGKDSEQFDARVAALSANYEYIKACDSEHMTFAEFAFEIVNLEALARQEMDKAVDNKMLRLAIGRQLKIILDYKAQLDFLSRMTALREAPFAVCLAGSTSVGKSCLQGLLTPMLQTATGVQSGPQHTFNWDPNDKYASGYSSIITAIVIDDLANIRPEYSTVQAPELVLMLINNFKRMAIMADIEDKGKITIKPSVVIGSTNAFDLNSAISVCPLSILRRFNYHVKVVVKDSCAHNHMFRTDINHNPSDHNYDCWVLDVYHYEPSHENPDDLSRYSIHYDLSGVCLSEALKFLCQAAKTYSTKQRELVQYMNNVHLSEYCECMIFRDICPTCRQGPDDLHLQSGVTEVLTKYTGNVRRFVGKSSHTMKNSAVAATVLRSMVYIFGLSNICLKFSKIYIAIDDLRYCPLTSIQCTTTILLDLVTLFVCIYTHSNMFVSILAIMGVTLMILLVSTCMRVYDTLTMSVPKTVTEGVKMFRRKINSRGYDYAPIVLIVASCSGAYMLCRRKLTAQGSKPMLPIPPDCMDRKDPFRPVSIRTVERNVDLATSAPMDVAVLLEKKLHIGVFDGSDTDKGSYCVIMPMCSGYWIVPYHIVSRGYKTISVVRKGARYLNDRRIAKIDGAWQRIADSDMALLYLPVMGDQKNLIKLLPSSSVHGSKFSVHNAGCLVSWAKPRKATVEDQCEFMDIESGVDKINVDSMSVKLTGIDYTYWGAAYMSQRPTWDGMCGSPVLLSVPGPTIVGFHSGGITTKEDARLTTVMREDVEKTLADMQKDTARVQMAESGEFAACLNFSGTPFGHTFSPRPHSTSEYIEGQYDHMGWNTAPKRTFRSAVEETPIAEKVCAEFGVEVRHERPAYMNSFVPWNKWFAASATPSDVPDPILNLAYNDYRAKIHSFWDNNPQLHWEDRIHPLSEDAVLAGADGIRGCYSVNLNTSMGIPWGKRKRQYIADSDEDVPGITRPLVLDDEIRKLIEETELKTSTRQRVYFPHRCNLKDEPVKKGKDKVRIFMGSNFVYLYLMRKYFLTLSMLMQDYPELFETAVGTNCMSYEWTKLHDHIFKYGSERCIAGDYAKYDQKFSVKINLASFKLLLTLLVRAGYNEQQINTCVVLMTETAIGVYDVNGEWIMFAALNPSGHGLTVVINGLGNSLYVRCGYYLMKPPNEVSPFHERVALMTYGDDNVMSVHEEAPWFTHTTLQAAMKEFGMDYTMADKTAESVPYIHESECSFLKRSWVWSEDHGRYLCPLEKLSIFKTLTVMKRSEVLTSEQQVAELIANANREFYFYGQHEFEVAHKKLATIAGGCGVLYHLPGSKLQSYSELENWFMSA